MKRTALVLALIIALLISVISGTQVVKVVKANPGTIESLTPPIIEISSPNNRTYTSRNVPLAFIVREPDVPWNPCSGANVELVSYSLDGSYPIFLILHGTYGREQFFNFSLTLSSLSEGSHNVYVHAISQSGTLSSYTERHSWITVYFNIDTISPVVSVLSPKSITFNKTELQLDFALNESSSWLGYSLDSEANVTITGNTTIAGLQDGPHELVVYANDTYGNTGSSEKINFTIAIAKEPEPFPAAIVATGIGILVTIVGVGLLVYFRKRKH